MDADKAQFLFGDEADAGELNLDAGLGDGPLDAAAFRDAVARAVAAQIAGDDPPEVWATARRLLAAGCSREDGLGQLHLAFTQAVADSVHHEAGSWDEDRYRRLLATLPLPRPRAVADAYVAVVSEHQPVPSDEADRLVAEQLGRPAHDPLFATLAGHVVDDLTGDGGDVDDHGSPLAYLTGDRLVHVGRFTAGSVLTRRLTETEHELDLLAAGFDLAVFARRFDLRLPDGRPLRCFPDETGLITWQGPTGWLAGHPAGTVLAVRTEDGVVHVRALDRDPPVDPALADRLRAVYDDLAAEPNLPVDGEELLLGLLASDPAAFAEPRAPLSALAAAAGLELRNGQVAHDDGMWARLARLRRFGRMLGRLDDGDAAAAAMAVVDAALGEGPDGPDGPDGPGATGESAGPADPAREALEAMADLSVAVAVLDEVLPADDPGDDQAARAVDWAGGLVAAAVEPAELGLARWVTAVVAERAGDVPGAEAYLALALEADPDFAPAIDRAAWYASDRGDAATALRLWRRLEEPDPADLRTLEPFTRLAGRRPGRNDPCWCGSGRKYKLCHRDQPASIPLPDRAGWLYRKAIGYVERRGGAATEALYSAACALALDPDDDASVDAALQDPIVVDAVLTEGGWFRRFLADRGRLLPEDEALLGQAWALVERTLYEVEDARPGHWVAVRDLRTGDGLRVRERTWRHQALPGTLACGRAVPDGESHQFVGRLFPVAPGREAEVLGLCDDAGPEELCAWVGGLERPPVLRTREDEPLVASRAVLEVDG